MNIQKIENTLVSFTEVFKGKNGVFLCIDFQDDRPPLKIETYLTRQKAKQLLKNTEDILKPLIASSEISFYYYKNQIDIFLEDVSSLELDKTVSIYFESF